MFSRCSDSKVLFLDLKEKDKSIDGYQESIWSYDTEHIDPSGNRKKENGIILNEFYGSDKPNNYISQFPVPIFNFTYREKEIDPEWESLRWFFYRLDKILFDKKNIFDSFDERVDTVFKIKDKTISLFRFTDCYEYEEFVYSLNDDIEALKNGSERFKKSLRTLPDNFEAFQKNYSSWKMHVYKRRDEMVYKYEDNSEIVKNVGIDSFQKVDQTLLEIYSLKYLEI